MSRAPQRVAILGGGTVGGSVIRALVESPDRLTPRGVPRLTGTPFGTSRPHVHAGFRPSCSPTRRPTSSHRRMLTSSSS
jgi:hypothetical protein